MPSRTYHRVMADDMTFFSHEFFVTVEPFQLPSLSLKHALPEDIGRGTEVVLSPLSLARSLSLSLSLRHTSPPQISTLFLYVTLGLLLSTSQCSGLPSAISLFQHSYSSTRSLSLPLSLSPSSSLSLPPSLSVFLFFTSSSF